MTVYKDDKHPGTGPLVEKILDKTGMKGTGKWTVQQAAELSVAAPTIEASLDGRFLSGLKVRFFWHHFQPAKFFEPWDVGCYDICNWPS